MAPPSGRERRLKPRYHASLFCALALSAEERDILFPDARLECRTRDLSESGIGLIAPSIYLGYTCIVDEGRLLRLELDTGAEVIELDVTSAHYLRLDDTEENASYLIGLRIAEKAGGSFAKYLEYLNALRAAEQ